MDLLVELESWNGNDWFTICGHNEGDRNVYLAEDDPEGVFYDPPVRTVWEAPANLPGARFLDHRILKRTINFKVDIYNEGKGWRKADSDWRKAWSYEHPSKLHVTSEDGHRVLNVQLLEQPVVIIPRDPAKQPYTTVEMTCVAGDPFWYGDTEVYEWITPTSTLDGSTLTHTFVFTEDNPLNPTDQILRPRWWASAPAKWTFPDYSFEDDDYAERSIVMPTLISGENIVIDRDPYEPQIVAENEAPVWARMNGVRFKHNIPAYTLDAELEVSVTLAPAGSKVQLYLDRPWSRAWGLW